MALRLRELLLDLGAEEQDLQAMEEEARREADKAVDGSDDISWQAEDKDKTGRRDGVVHASEPVDAREEAANAAGAGAEGGAEAEASDHRDAAGGDGRTGIETGAADSDRLEVAHDAGNAAPSDQESPPPQDGDGEGRERLQLAPVSNGGKEASHEDLQAAVAAGERAADQAEPAAVADDGALSPLEARNSAANGEGGDDGDGAGGVGQSQAPEDLAGNAAVAGEGEETGGAADGSDAAPQDGLAPDGDVEKRVLLDNDGEQPPPAANPSQAREDDGVETL